MSSKVYPKAIRSTMNGMSAAIGKLGAVCGAYMFGTVADLSSFTASYSSSAACL